MGYKAFFASVALAFVSVSSCLASDVEHKTATYAAHSIILDRMQVDVSVRTHQQSDVTVIWSGPSEWVAALSPRLNGETLSLDGRDLPQVSGTLTSVTARNITVTATGGSSASVTIGDASSEEGARSPTIDILMPADAMLTIRNLDGSATVAPLKQAIYASVSSGSILLEGLKAGGELIVSGSGNIVVETAEGKLQVSVPGSGSISVEASALSDLTASIPGNGMIDVKGYVDTAMLSVSGAGMITVEKVRKTAQRSITGAGTIFVGNE